MSLLVLSAADVAKVTAKFTPDELVALMADVFSRLSERHRGIHQPHRTTIPMEHHTALFMPSRISSAGTTIKVVSVPSADAPKDIKEKGLPGTTIVLDERSGGVRAVVNARRLTALRNAAGSLLSARLALPEDAKPRHILAIGAGAQIQAHLALFLTAYPSIEECTIYNRSRNTRLETLREMLASTFSSVRVATGVLPSAHSKHGEAEYHDAVKQADIIITATSSTHALFPSRLVRKGAHLCLIGSYKPEMHEIDTDLVRRAGVIIVDQKTACLQEAGELIDAELSESDLIELGELFDYKAKERAWIPREGPIEEVQTSGDVTIFKSVGVGVQDVAIVCAVADRAVKEKIGVVIDAYDEDE
ncbi:Ketimine reductase mu-crystallin [Trametes pubescens]|uniref:Ketimine reductase mu-crystallin n=1 Tax=Trametes pubescens TaxID=154538 RepID=A0A1M2VT64_TRAPU|nr:Ketimine reductase mu-crystallin [Trametes pubescens]